MDCGLAYRIRHVQRLIAEGHYFVIYVRIYRERKIIYYVYRKVRNVGKLW